MPSFALIGLGDNSKNLHQPLLDTAGIRLLAVCDKDPTAAGRRYYAGIPFFQDYQAISVPEEIDFFYIATEPESHYEIAAALLKQGRSVLCEKPVTKRFEDYLSLRQLATDNHAFFNVVYHFRFSNEILWVHERLSSLGVLRGAQVFFNDPYYLDHRIINGREKLLGCWFDSASNILSAFSFLFPEMTPTLISKTFEEDAVFHLPVSAAVDFMWNGALFQVKILWGETSTSKQFRLQFENGEVLLDFSGQEVHYNGEKVAAFNFARATPSHYYNFFANFEDYKAIGQNDAVTEFLYTV